MRVSYLGPEGTYTEEAAQFFFQLDEVLTPKATVNDAIADVLSGEADYAVIPQENTVGGAVVNYVDALIAARDAHVVGEVVLPISQTLMGLPGASLSDIQTVCSHAQGLAQSAKWRAERLPDAAVQEMPSTAAAASYVAETGDISIAAVAAPGAAALYGLDVLAENVQITDANKTRFYVLSRDALDGESLTRAAFVATCAGGELDGILAALRDAELDIISLHDRPEGSQLGKYHYVIEVECAAGITDAQISTVCALNGVRFAGRFNAVEKGAAQIPGWAADSPAMASIVAFVNAVTDKTSPDYVPPEARIVLFDSDGTLIGERYPNYSDQCMLLQRLLHDVTNDGNPEDVAFAEAMEAAIQTHAPLPSSPRSTAQMSAEYFKGFTVEQYRAYIREFMKQPVPGFEGMTYGRRFFVPMVELVRYLAERDFQVYINSGTERIFLREMTADTLGKWIPPYRVIGSTFSLTATGQGDTAGRDYTLAPDDQVILEGNMTFKNLKVNKVYSTIDEIGMSPIMVFGNSSGDFAMGQYAVQHGGRAWMLLCDDTERDYGDTDEAASFAEKCAALGFETVSMRDEFETIYGEGITMAASEALEPAA
ncbi:MAG: prephenate dehydratase domain-containing protein [bacterium]